MMSRECKRVPSGFTPPKEVWFGYVLDAILCKLCNGTGERPHGPTVTWHSDPKYASETTFCELCEGEGTVVPHIEVPNGFAYQMWETCSEGSPISPTFDTPEELARWLADTGASACGHMTATYDQWLATIKQGCVATMIQDAKHGLRSGVAASTD